MTPAHLVGLAALLIGLRDWLMENEPGGLDAVLVDAVVDVCARVRTRLVEEGAK
jgi:hypothetical protein